MKFKYRVNGKISEYYPGQIIYLTSVRDEIEFLGIIDEKPSYDFIGLTTA